MKTFIFGLVLGLTVAVSPVVYAQTPQTPEELANILNTILALVNEEVAETRAELAQCQAQLGVPVSQVEPIFAAQVTTIDVDVQEIPWTDSQNLGRKAFHFNLSGDWEKAQVTLKNDKGEELIGTGLTSTKPQTATMTGVYPGTYSWEVVVEKSGKKSTKSGVFVLE